MELRFADLDEVRLAYQVHGTGARTVVLLHGWPQTSLCWRHVTPRLADRFTVVVPDLRGYGASGLAARYDKRSMAGDLHELIGMLGIGSVAVVGHDRGARVAHRWALDHPEDIDAVAVLDILPTREVLRTFDLRTATSAWHWLFHLQPELPELLLAGRVEPYLASFFAHARTTGAIDEDTFARYVAALSAPGRLEASLEDYRAQFHVDMRADENDHDAGRRVTAPLLALWGAAGSLGNVDVASVWSRYASGGVSAYALAGCRHYLPEERPVEVADAVCSFVLDSALS